MVDIHRTIPRDRVEAIEPSAAVPPLKSESGKSAISGPKRRRKRSKKSAVKEEEEEEEEVVVVPIQVTKKDRLNIDSCCKNSDDADQSSYLSQSDADTTIAIGTILNEVAKQTKGEKGGHLVFEIFSFLNKSIVFF